MKRVVNILLALIIICSLFLGVFNVTPIEASSSVTVYASWLGSGTTAYNQGAVYNTVQGAASGSGVDTNGYLGQGLGGGIYSVYRTFLSFDTSVIPSSATILSAVVNLYIGADQSATDFDIQVQNGQPNYPHASLVVGDYDKTNYSGNGGTLNTAGIALGYNNLTLNATGMGWINKGGTTRLALRSSLDISSTAPIGLDRVTVNISPPAYTKITITYTAPPTVTCDAATGIGSTSATLNATITDDGGDAGNVQVRWGYGTTSQTAVNFSNYDHVTTYSGAYSTGSTPSLALTTLLAGTTYYYRVQAQNSVGAMVSTGQGVFTTSIAAPTINCDPASIVGVNSAQLNATVTYDGGEACDVRWGYGTVSHTAADFALYTTVTAFAGSYRTNAAPLYAASGLAESTTYYYRVQVRNSTGSVTSSVEQSFTTAASVGNISVFNGYPATTSVNLSFVMGTGDSKAAIYYKTTPYTDPNPTLITNGSFETAVISPPTPDDWLVTGAGASIARSNTQVKTGSFSMAVTRAGADCGGYQDLTATLPSWASYKGQTLTFGCWVWASSANTARIDILDGVTATVSSYHTGGSTWEWFSVTQTIDGAAPFIHVDCQVNNNNVTAYFDGAVLIVGTAYPAEGTRIYFNNGSNYTHTGLSAGTTYYYVAFGESGDIYSPAGKYLTVTTLGISATSLPTGGSMPVPTFPSSMFATPDPSKLSRFEPFYSLINGFATSWGMPNSTMWATIVLIIIALIGMIVLIESRNVGAALGVTSVLILGAVIMGLISAWFVVVMLIMDIGVWAVMHNSA